MNKKRRQKGFSLLETIIASSIFSAVLLLASSAFKFYMSAGTRAINSKAVVEETMAAIKLRNSISGIQHYYLKINALSNDASSLFFLGDRTGFVGITDSSINFSGQSTRVSVSKEQAGGGMYSLVYCEFDNRKNYPLLEVSGQCDQPVMFIQNLVDADFSYFGYKSLDSLYSLSASQFLGNYVKTKEWSSDWDATRRKILPQYVKISLVYKEGKEDYKPKDLWFRLQDADPLQIKVNNQTNE